jgi:cytochrome c biogenesis protein CcdA
MNFSELIKSKTFWAAISGVIATVGAVFSGAMTWSAAIMPILTAIIGIFLKDGQVSQTKAMLACKK